MGRSLKKGPFVEPKLLKAIKDTPEYNNAAWLLSYQIRSLLQTAKRIK